jgi:Holliday junction resolvase RusA-like endonuclease
MRWWLAMSNNNSVRYPITPMGAPRMTRADAWKKRPVVIRYREFKDAVRDHGVVFENGDGVVFNIPMPQSWSAKKKASMCGTGCRSKPDIDNLFKALLDALYEDDAHIFSVSRLEKLWAHDGSIEIFKKDVDIDLE